MTVEPTRMHLWTTGPLDADVARALRRLRTSPDVVAVAVMPDVHLASDVCIGTVVATTRLLYPNAVGGDIGCGMAALRFAGPVAAIDEPRVAARILAGLAELVPVLVHHATAEAPSALFGRPLSSPALERHKARDGLRQLGTLGRGNHFLELQGDDEGTLWLMLHTGSRGLGQRIRDHHLHGCAGSAGGLRYLDAESDSGRAYLADVAWALDYADENRRRILAAAAEVVEVVTGLAAEVGTTITCHHNHVVRVSHADGGWWVHRKGAISALDGQPGIIPGSMGDPSFHVVGRGVAEALWSSSHGAGRAMSRSEARLRIHADDFERQVEGVWFERRLTRRLVDEAPGAYKDIGKVMRAQRELTRVVRRLRPVLSYKGV